LFLCFASYIFTTALEDSQLHVRYMYVMNSSFERFASANKHLHKDTKINVKYYQNQNFQFSKFEAKTL